MKPHDNSVVATANGSTVASTVTGIAQTNYGYKGIKVSVNITKNTGASGSITVNIIGMDANNKDDLLLASTTLTAVASTQLRVHPDLTAVANTIAKDVLPGVFRVDVVQNNTSPISYSVAYSVLK